MHGYLLQNHSTREYARKMRVKAYQFVFTTAYKALGVLPRVQKTAEMFMLQNPRLQNKIYSLLKLNPF